MLHFWSGLLSQEASACFDPKPCSFSGVAAVHIIPPADTISYQHEALYVPQHPLKGGALESSYRHSHRLDFFDKNRYPCEVEPHRGIYSCHIHRKRRQSFLCRGGG